MKARQERRDAMPTSPNHIARARCWLRSGSTYHSVCLGALIMNDPPRIRRDTSGGLRDPTITGGQWGSQHQYAQKFADVSLGAMPNAAAPRLASSGVPIQ